MSKQVIYARLLRIPIALNTEIEARVQESGESVTGFILRMTRIGMALSDKTDFTFRLNPEREAEND